MKRKIKFRGKRVDNGEWVYGDYIKVTPHKDNDGHRICSQDSWDIFEIDPETVGQFTGFRDLIEGDICNITVGNKTYPNCEIIFEDGAFMVKYNEYLKGNRAPTPLCGFTEDCKFEVVGNVHDSGTPS